MTAFETFVRKSPLRAVAQEFIEIRSLQKRVNVAADKIVLEIGCGNGTGTKHLNKYFKPRKLYAIDNDAGSIAEAQKHHAAPEIIYEVADVTNLPYNKEMFDIVFDFSVLYHSGDWKKALDEIWRVLKPGGKFILEDLTIETPGFDISKYVRRLFMHTYKKPYKREAFFAYFVAQGWHLSTKKVFNPLGFEYFIVVAGKPHKN